MRILHRSAPTLPELTEPSRGQVLAVISAIGYTLLVLAGTLYPFRFAEPRHVRDLRNPAPAWSENGMTFHGTGMFSLGRKSPELVDAVRDAGVFGVHVELRTADDERRPRRIVSLEASPYRPAFTLSQVGDALRLRIGGENATTNDYIFWDVLPDSVWSDVWITVAPDSVRAWHDGRVVAGHRTVGFAPDSWPDDPFLVAGNDTNGEVGWEGDLAVLALFAPDAADLPDRLEPIFLADGRANRRPPAWEPHKTDVRGRTADAPWSLVPFSEPADRAWARHDWIQNLVLFVPLGMILSGLGWRIWVVALACLGLSAGIELTQVFLPLRHTQATDVVLNTLGGALGAFMLTSTARRA